MDFLKLRRVLIWGSPPAAFALCWAWTIAAWGSTGVHIGWVPAAIVAPLAAVLASGLCSVVGLAALLGWHVYAADRGGPLPD